MDNRTIKLFVLAGVVLFLLLLINSIPARLVLAHVSKAVPDFYAEGVDGTIWSGSASNVVLRVNGTSYQLGATNWRISALPLLWGSLALDLQAKHGQQQVTGSAVLGLGGSVSLEDTDLVLAAGSVQPFVPLPVTLDGMFSVHLKDFALDDGRIEEMDGSVTWEQAGMDLGSGGMLRLGTYVAELSMNENDDYHAELLDIDATLGLSGQLDMQAADKRYSLNARLEPRPGLDPAVRNMLTQFGNPGPDGKINVQYSGSL